MAKILFDIKYRPQIESGEYKVETRDGNPVRIICWDLKGNEDFFIMALVEKNGREVSYCYHATGCCKAALDPDGKDDLFLITPEPELSEWETFLSGCLQKHGLLDCGVADRIAKNCSAELLDLAEREIAKGHEHDVYIPEDTYYEQLKKQWEEGYDKSKAEALKDLPRWKKIGRGNNYSSEVKFAINGRYLEMNDTLNDVYEIKLPDLEKLPKED